MAEHRGHAERLQAELEQARQASSDQADRTAGREAEIGRLEARLTEHTEELAEAHDEVEQLRRELDKRDRELKQVRRDAQAETRRVQLESLSAAAETEARATDRAEITAASAQPAARSLGRARAQQIPAAAVPPPSGSGTADLGVPDRIRLATQTLPSQAIVGIVLIVLGVVIAILFLTGQLG